jgi:hypothetical protein
MGNTLHDFSGNLIDFLQNVTVNMSNMQKSQDAMIYTIQNLESNLQVTTRELAYLRSETVEQKRKLDEITSSVILVNPMGTATTNNQVPSAVSISPSRYTQEGDEGDSEEASPGQKQNPSTSSQAGQMMTSPSVSVNSETREKASQSKGNAVSKEFSLKFQLSKALLDAVMKYSNQCARSPRSLSRTLSALPEQPVEERLDNIEASLVLQENINKINAAIVKSNNEISQYGIDTVQSQIRKLESDLAASKAETDTLKAAISDVYAKFIMYANSRAGTPRDKTPHTSRSNVFSKSMSATPAPLQTNENGSNAIHPFWNHSPASAGGLGKGLSAASGVAETTGSGAGKGRTPRSILDAMLDGGSGNNDGNEINPSQGNDYRRDNDRSIALQMLEAVMPPAIDDETRMKINRADEMTSTLEKTTKKMSKAIENIMTQIEELRERVNRPSVNQIQSPPAHKFHADTPRSTTSTAKPSFSNNFGVRVSGVPFMNKVNNVKDRWSQIVSDLKYGLLRHAVEAGHISNFPNILEEESPETKGLSVLHKAEEFTLAAAEAIQQLDFNENIDDPHTAVFPQLDKITVLAEDLVTLDESAKEM